MAKRIKKATKNKKTVKLAEVAACPVYYIVLIIRFFYRLFIKLPYRSNYLIGLFRVFSLGFIWSAFLCKWGDGIFFDQFNNYYPQYQVALSAVFGSWANGIDIIIILSFVINWIIQLCVVFGLSSAPRYLSESEVLESIKEEEENRKYPGISQTMRSLDAQLRQESPWGQVKLLHKIFGSGK